MHRLHLPQNEINLQTHFPVVLYDVDLFIIIFFHMQSLFKLSCDYCYNVNYCSLRSFDLWPGQAKFLLTLICSQHPPLQIFCLH